MLKTVAVVTGITSTGFPITLGNTSVAASSTTTTLNNLTLGNVTITTGTINAVKCAQSIAFHLIPVTPNHQIS